MKKIYFLLFACFLAIGAVGAQTTVYAYRTFQPSNPANVQKGPVKFSSATPSVVELIADQSRLGSVYAGTYFNYKWYAQVTKPGTQSSLEGLYTIDMTDGSRELISTQGSHLVEMTYDYSTSTMYGIKNGAEYLMTLDIHTGATTEVGAFANNGESVYMLALACHVDGTMYGISTDDNLYRIDKATAACTLVGSTGVNAAYTQSMDFDRNTGVLYWANVGDYKLYTVDITTGAATLIGSIGENGDDSMTSMFIPYIHVPAGAPDRVLERKVAASGNSAVLSWRNPSVDAQGNALTELTGVKVYRGEDLVTTVAVTADKIGQPMEYIDENLSDGLYSYRLVPVNSKGDGGVDSDDISTYVGENAPGEVVDFTVSQGDSEAILTWKAPEDGMYGGSFDPSSITKYVVTRSNGTASTEIEISDPSATSYIDTPGFGTYTYSIYAVNAMGNGLVSTAAPIIVKPADWIVMTTGEAVVESGKTYHFYDAAGPNAYYPNSQNDTLTIRPQSANGLVHVSFKQFATDTYGDYLYIFNGADTHAPLMGEFTSTSVPSALVSLESTSEDGALTFVFYSDIMSRDEGWEAEVTVTEKKQHDLVAVSLEGNLYPNAGAEATYAFTVRNKGVEKVAAADYKVKLLDNAGSVLAEVNGVEIESMETVVFDMKFTPSESGDMSIHAEIEYAGDDDSANNESAVLSVMVLEEGSQFISIGEHDEELLVLPVSFMSGESISETIYYKDEIGIGNGTLQMISYPISSVGTSYSNVPVKIWVGETELADLSETSVPADDMTLVFDGTMNIAPGDEEWVFQLATPYSYKGGNLLILMLKGNPGFTSYDVGFKGTYGVYDVDPQRSRYNSTFDDSEVLDPNVVPIGYSSSTMWADVKLLFTDTNSGIANPVDEPSVRVYPNPVNDVLYVEGDNIRAIEIFDGTGRRVYTSDSRHTVDMAAYPAGIYYLRIMTDEGLLAVKKIVKN